MTCKVNLSLSMDPKDTAICTVANLTGQQSVLKSERKIRALRFKHCLNTLYVQLKVGGGGSRSVKWTWVPAQIPTRNTATKGSQYLRTQLIDF